MHSVILRQVGISFAEFLLNLDGTA